MTSLADLNSRQCGPCNTANPPLWQHSLPALQMHPPHSGFPTSPQKAPPPSSASLGEHGLLALLSPHASSSLRTSPANGFRYPLDAKDSQIHGLGPLPCPREPTACQLSSGDVPRTSQACRIQDRPSSQPPEPGAPLGFVVSAEAPGPPRSGGADRMPPPAPPAGPFLHPVAFPSQLYPQHSSCPRVQPTWLTPPANASAPGSVSSG